MSVSQWDVDFVIPRVGVDIPLGIDPFLLFKSRDPSLAQLHAQIVAGFNAGVDALRRGDRSKAQYILSYPEVAELGLGYSRSSRSGSGVGTYIGEMIVETLADSEPLMARGVRHIEEMQLVSVGIGPDRISDIAGNLIKKYLIDYTQRQCALWDIPTKTGVPVAHIWDPDGEDWFDGYFDLPVSVSDGRPILLAPRRVVRSLPWINYDDYLRVEFPAFLRARKVRAELASGTKVKESKTEVVAATRAEVVRIDRYVDEKERTAMNAEPSDEYLSDAPICTETARLQDALAAMPPGTSDAAAYQRLVLEIINLLFSPDLIDGQMEVKTEHGSERRDILFVNDSDKTFWAYLRAEHSSFLLMFETKNKMKVGPEDINQTIAYLGDRLGRLAFIVTREAMSDASRLKLFAQYNDSQPRKIVLWLSDADLRAMLDLACAGRSPMEHVRDLYRAFRQRVQ